MRRDLFRQYLRLPGDVLRPQSTGTMLSRLTFNIEQVAEATTNSTGALIRDSLTIILQIGWLFLLNWKLALFVVILAPPLSWLIRQVTKSFRRYSARIQASMGDVTRVTKEALDGQRVIKVFNAQEQEARDFETVNEHNRRSNMKLIAARATSNPVVQFIASLGLGGVLWMALVQVNEQRHDGGAVLGLPDRAAADHRADAHAGERVRAAAAGPRRRRQRVRSARRAHRGLQAAASSGALAARSNSAT